MKSAASCRRTSRQLNRVLQMLEESPQSIVFGPPRHAPGPGEAGFVAPTMSARKSMKRFG
jgi:phospholipid/cholesterol/gamma-HCH transport system substrate-binding protein